MIEMSWAQAKSPAFQSGFQKLITANHGQKLNYHLMRIANLIDAESKVYKMSFEKILRKYNALNDDGTYNVPPEHKGEFLKDMEDLGNIIFKIDKHKLSMNDIKCDLTAAELLVLQPLLLDLEVIEGGNHGDKTEEQTKA